MRKEWPKIVYDPVYKVISFDDTPSDRLLLSLINSSEFQRLRRIKQLGMCELVFPGTTHTRFAHSIGVTHIAKRFLDRIEKLNGQRLDEGLRTVVLAAALLHDIGHGPFSHAFEKVTGDSHEKRAVEIISDKSTEINAILSAVDPMLPEQVKSFFNHDHNLSNSGAIPPYLTQIISSQLDADRSDYLLRDSLASGVEYGIFDFEWLINHLYLNEEQSHFYLSYKALAVAEAYIFARYHMYRCVYFHKTTRSAEMMLKLVFKRFKEIVNSGLGFDDINKIIPQAPRNIVEAFTGKMDLDQYLLLDDYSVSGFLKACAASSDEILKRLGNGLINRKLYKVIDVSDKDPGFLKRFSDEAADRVIQLGYNPDYVFAFDNPGDTPYKPYEPDSTQPVTQIYIEDLNGREVEIGTLSGTVNELKKKYTFIRYYCPKEIKEELNKILCSEF